MDTAQTRHTDSAHRDDRVESAANSSGILLVTFGVLTVLDFLRSSRCSRRSVQTRFREFLACQHLRLRSFRRPSERDVERRQRDRERRERERRPKEEPKGWLSDPKEHRCAARPGRREAQHHIAAATM